MKKLVMMCVALGGMACAVAGTPPRPAIEDVADGMPANSDSAGCCDASGEEYDRIDVTRAVESLFAAMRSRDTTAIRAAFAPNSQLVSIRTALGSPPRVQVTPVSAFITSIGRATEALDEKMWDPRVEVAGDMASLWAPYDFRIGTTFSHCGHDAVHLARTAEGWKVVGVTYTVITAGCSAR